MKTISTYAVSLRELLNVGVKTAGYAAVATWASVYGIHYLWQWTGWTWLASLNGFLIAAFSPIMWAGTVLLGGYVLMKIGSWIKGLFTGE